jgi:hypothetical protein
LPRTSRNHGLRAFSCPEIGSEQMKSRPSFRVYLVKLERIPEIEVIDLIGL